LPIPVKRAFLTNMFEQNYANAEQALNEANKILNDIEEGKYSSGDFHSGREEKADALWKELSLKEKIEALEKMGFDMEESLS